MRLVCEEWGLPRHPGKCEEQGGKVTTLGATRDCGDSSIGKRRACASERYAHRATLHRRANGVCFPIPSRRDVLAEVVFRVHTPRAFLLGPQRGAFCITASGGR